MRRSTTAKAGRNVAARRLLDARRALDDEAAPRQGAAQPRAEHLVVVDHEQGAVGRDCGCSGGAHRL